jgi:hypothetical protein
MNEDAPSRALKSLGATAADIGLPPNRPHYLLVFRSEM